jgi:hypothetical protein
MLVQQLHSIDRSLRRSNPALAMPVVNLFDPNGCRRAETDRAALGHGRLNRQVRTPILRNYSR